MIVFLLTAIGLASAPLTVPAIAASSDSTSAADTVAVSPADSVFTPGPALGDSIVLLPEVHVDRDRAASEARKRAPTAFVSELTAGTSGRALESVAELLEQSAGVRVIQYGGLGAFSTVSVRGAPANQVAVYLDGAPLTSAAHGVVSLSDLPVTAIDRIEVYRGVSPLAMGTAAPGGAINLVTLSATGRSDVRTALGSWNTWETRASLSGVRGPLAGLLHFGYQGSDGDFEYADDNGTPFNALDDSLSRRLNNRFDAASGLASLTWRPSSTVRVGAREDLFQKIQGVPGLGQVPAFHPRLAYLRSLSQLDAAWEGARALPTVSVRGSFQHERTNFTDTNAELGLGRHDTNDHVNGGGVALELAWRKLPLGFTVHGVGELRDDRALLTDAADGQPDPPQSRRLTRGVAAGVEWRPVGENVVATLAQRWDRLSDQVHTSGVGNLGQSYEVTREIQSPQIGLLMRGPIGLEVRANTMHSERAPDFLELFGYQGSVLGNPALRPEHVSSWDTGVVWAIPTGAGLHAGLEWAHFESYAHDLVIYVRNSQSSVRAQNIARSTIAGDELTLRASGPFGFRTSGAFTWQSAIDHGPVPFWSGKRLPQHPARAGNVRLEWRTARLGLGAMRVKDVTVASSVEVLGDNYLDRYNRQRVASRTFTDASLSFAPFISTLRLTVEGKNLGDCRVQDVAGFPLPGRSWFVACEWRTRATSLD